MPPATPGAIPASDPLLVPPVLVTPLVPVWPAGLVVGADASPVDVQVLLTVDATGRVTHVTPLDDTDPAPFLTDALAVTRALSLRPATEEGTPVAVEVPLTLTYTPPPVNLGGVVVDAAGKPLTGVPVAVGTWSAVTDASGRFGLRGVPTGTWEVHADAPGQRAVNVAVTAGVATDVLLAPDEAESQGESEGRGVIGTWRRQREEVVRRVLTAEEVRTTPGTLGDPLRAISNLPGAVRTPLDAGWLLVRGGDPRDTGVYIDGVRVPLVYHLGGFTSVVHPAFVQQVEFIPGGQSARYGRATAGVVDLVTAPPPAAVDVHAGANLILAGVYAAAPFRGGGVMIGARRSYLDVVLDAIPGITPEEASIAPRFYDAEARVEAGPTRWTGLTYVDHVDTSTSDTSHVIATVGTWRVHEETSLEVAGRRLDIRPYVGEEWYRLDVATVGRDQEERRSGGGIRVETPDAGTDPVGWSAGVDATADHFRVDYNLVHRTGLLVSPEAYGDLRIGVERRVVLGLRVDDLFVTDQLPRAALSPRVAARIPIRDDLTLHADFGVYHQPPPPDLLVGPPEGASLRLEESVGGGGGAATSVGPVEVEASAYARRINHLTAFELDGTLGQGEGLAYGVETLTRYRSGRVSGWMTLGWSRSLRREDRGLPWAPSLYDQPLTVALIGAWDAGKRWTLASRVRYGSGFVPPPVASPQAYDVLTNRTVDLTSYVPGRLPAFHALDIKISKRTAGQRWSLDWYLDAQNLTNRRVPEPVITGFADLSTNYVYGYGLPILLIFGVDGRFSGGTSPTPAP